MLKSELRARLATSLSIPASMADAVITQISDIIVEEVKNGGEVTITGLGCFTSRFCKEKRGHDIKDPTKTVIIPPMRLPRFRVSEAFKRAIRNSQTTTNYEPDTT